MTVFKEVWPWETKKAALDKRSICVATSVLGSILVGVDPDGLGSLLVGVEPDGPTSFLFSGLSI